MKLMGTNVLVAFRLRLFSVWLHCKIAYIWGKRKQHYYKLFYNIYKHYVSIITSWEWIFSFG